MKSSPNTSTLAAIATSAHHFRLELSAIREAASRPGRRSDGARRGASDQWPARGPGIRAPSGQAGAQAQPCSLVSRAVPSGLPRPEQASQPGPAV